MTSPPGGAIVRLRAFGAVELRGPAGGNADGVLARPKLVALLVYLAAASRGFVRRDTLVGILWPEMDQDRARSALRQSLYYLRQFLGEAVLLTRGDEEVALAADVFWSDVAEFDRTLEAADREAALELYRGPLLEGFFLSGAPEFERWLEGRREELRRRARTAALELAEQLHANGDTGAAARWARHAAALDPLDETLARQVIRLLDRAGDRAGALRVYDAFARRLEVELDVEPSPETKALAQEVRSRAEAPGAGVPPPVANAPAGTPAAVAVGAEATSPPVSTARWRWNPRSRAARVGLGALGVLVVAAAATWGIGLSTAGWRSLDARRVVVAVFENLTGDPALDPLGRMAADWVTQGLDQLAVIDVVPSTAGLAPRVDFRTSGGAGSLDVRALARGLGAGTVVAGSYYRSGDSISFQAQVVDARNGRLLSAVPTAVGTAGAAAAVVDTLRRLVVGTVLTVFDARVSPVAGGRPPSLDAYRAYLEGYRAYQQAPQQMREALTFLNRAVELDSTFLDPRILLVWAHLNLGEYREADSAAQVLARSRQRLTPIQGHVLDWQLALLRGDRTGSLDAARAVGGAADVGVEALRVNRPREAIALLAGADGLEGMYYQRVALMDAYHMVGDHRRELREAVRARRAYPRRQRMLLAEVRALAALGRHGDVERRLDESLVLPPEEDIGPANVMADAAAEFRAHGYREASLAAADRALAWYASRPPEEAAGGDFRFRLATVYYQRERWADAERLFSALASEGPRNVNVQGFLGVLAARRGDRARAMEISDRLPGLAAPGDFGRDVYWQGCIASLLGERERAVGLLREAYARGRVFAVTLHRDMDLEPLRDYPPYQRFVEPRA